MTVKLVNPKAEELKKVFLDAKDDNGLKIRTFGQIVFIEPKRVVIDGYKRIEIEQLGDKTYVRVLMLEMMRPKTKLFARQYALIGIIEWSGKYEITVKGQYIEIWLRY